MSAQYRKLPLVYACSGCSSAAQTANRVAVQLDRAGIAEMSCIAGVGGNVPHLVDIARSGRPILAIDGCPLVCVRSCLTQRGVEADSHIQLHELGVRKKQHGDVDPEQTEAVYRQAEQQIRLLQRRTSGSE